jgi:hypothetical protein
MTRVAVRAVLALSLIGMGWTIGRAQSPGPDFELKIDAPQGQTNVVCVRGCELAWIERMLPGTIDPRGQTTFTYRCGGGSAGQRCESGRIGGWTR